MLLALRLTPANIFLVLGPAMLLVFFFVLWLIRRQHHPGPAALTAEGEIVDFNEQLLGQPGDAALVTRLQVRFRTRRGETITGPTPTGNSLTRLLYRRGQRVQVQYNPENPRQFSVGSFDNTNYTLIIVVFCVIAGAFLLLGAAWYLLGKGLMR
jgi:Protein of unknown function (DUF3592)